MARAETLGLVQDERGMDGRASLKATSREDARDLVQAVLPGLSLRLCRQEDARADRHEAAPAKWRVRTAPGIPGELADPCG